MMVLVPTGGGASFDNVCKTLFGDAFDPQVAKASPDQADVNAGGRGEKKKRTAAENIALATNAGGVLAGPGAVYSSVRNHRENTGGIPREVATAIGRRRDRRTGKKGFLTRTAETLNTRRGRAGAAGATVAGVTGIGLQLANTTGDAIAANHFKSAGKKQEEKVTKAEQGQGTKVPNPLDSPAGRFAQDTKRFAKTPAGKTFFGGAAAYTGYKGLQSTGRRREQGVYLDPYSNFGKSDEDDESVFAGEFSKFDDDKRLAFGWASIVEMNGVPVVDKQGDYIALDDLEDAAYTYVHKSRVGGDMHRRNGDAPHHVSDMIESIVFTDDKVEKMGLPDDFPRGWWVGFKVHDDQTWDLVRKKGRTGFSIHGKGLRKDVPLDEVMGY